MVCFALPASHHLDDQAMSALAEFQPFGLFGVVCAIGVLGFAGLGLQVGFSPLPIYGTNLSIYPVAPASSVHSDPPA
jgi:hypothetical protein